MIPVMPSLALTAWAAANQKRRAQARGPEHGDPVWRVSLTDEDGDAYDGKGGTLDAAILDAFGFERAGIEADALDAVGDPA
jgi:hypothetical protein